MLWGAWVPGVPWDMSQQDAFESRVGKRVGIIHFGQGWQWDRVYQPFYPGDYQRIMDRGAVPLLDWGPWDLSARRSVNQPSFALARIIDGDHDTYIRDWATAVMAWGQPLWVRFAWKMNSLWFPWCEGVNDNQPGDYIRAWQHVVDIFRDVGATNVAWVWCPNAVYLGATPLASLFPGETYVDWIGYDAYNWGTTYGAEWTSVAATLDPTYALMRQVSASKPIMLGEIACSENGGSKAAWISDLFAALPRDYPEITALVWFNWNAGNADLDWPIESSVAATAAFAAGINASRYRAGGD